MKSRKRNHIFFMLTAILVLSLSGCGSSGDRAGQPEGNNEELNSTGGTGTAGNRESEGESAEERNGTQTVAAEAPEPM